jgi:hypothetical protein
MGCPLPLLGSPETVVSVWPVARCGGVTQWSRVYDWRDRVCKQTTGGRAPEAAALLARLDGPRFPRVLDARDHGGASVVVLEKIDGAPLTEETGRIRADRARWCALVTGLIEALIQLQDAGVTHRDIHGANVLIRTDGQPALIDFEWAADPEVAPRTPVELNVDGRPPDGTFCDVYATGRLLDAVRGDAHSDFDGLLGLMAAPDPGRRVTDARLLRRAAAALVAPAGDDESWSAVTRRLLRRLEAAGAVPPRAVPPPAPWRRAVEEAVARLAAATEPEELVLTFGLADCGLSGVPGRRHVALDAPDRPLWGPPTDEAAAIEAVETHRAAGAAHLALLWPAFWLLDCYDGFAAHLQSRYRCVHDDDRLVLFDLRR